MNKEYDAVYVHGQGYSERPGRDAVPSVRGRLQASAIRAMLNSGYRIDNYLFSGIPFKCQTIPMADINARAVKRRARLVDYQMTVDQTARTTSMEVAFARRHAEKNGWKRVLHLTYGDVHQDQIEQHVKRHYGRRGIGGDVFRADEILTDSAIATTHQAERNLERYQCYIDGYNQGETEQGILFYERRKYKFMNWPFDLGNKALNLVSRFYRPDPSN